MDILELLKRFNGVKKIGENSWQCICPTHADEKASLTITVKDGKILMHCHAGCELKDILNSVGLKESDLFNDVSKNQQSKVTSEYIYTDEDNKPLYKVIRYEPKRFVQAKYVNGKYVYKMNDVRHVLYNLPNVIKSEEIYFVEGEKDANNLNKIGLTATTTVGGAASFNKYKDEYIKHLKGKTVYIIPDNDKAGYKYANKIYSSLPGVAKEFKTLYLASLVSDLKEKGDISDVLSIVGKEKTLHIIERLKRGTTNNRMIAISNNNTLNMERFKEIIDNLGIQIKYNNMSGSIDIINFKEEYSKDNILNTFPIWITNYINNLGVKCTEQKVQKFMTAEADINRYNPAKDLIESLTWDKHSRLEELYTIMGITNEDYKTYIKKWLLQTVVLQYNTLDKGITPDGILILQGKQRLGKTSFFRKIALEPSWFLEGATFNTEKKDDMISCFSFFICELGEIDYTLKKGQTAFKGIMTRASDTIRYPYEKAFTTKPRVTSFCGTVNEENFIKDLTGSSRLWIVKLDDNFDTTKVLGISKEWIQQLWAEIKSILDKEGEDCFRLTPEERAKLEENNKIFDAKLVGEQEIEDNLDFSLEKGKYKKLTATEVKEKLELKNLDSSKIGKALTHLCSKYPDYIRKGRKGNNIVYELPLKK